ncbi:Tn3 family transposase [Herbaspirillum huttiense]|jgi:TnpA family transposase|uniref:Tn3 family transposase n=1 Tax=Herbaspirillum TaxID=963 RepID=UPI0024DEDA10|nr:Tn3 family transposase [Herbaspirillum aquaticum]
MDHWHAPYLGLRHIPAELNEFELNTFFTFSVKERALINDRRRDLYKLALALHLGFVRMTGRTLDAYKQIPKALWTHVGEQLEIAPPDIGTLRSLYDTRPRTLVDHQQLAYQTLGFGSMTEHQRRYLVRWLKETLVGRPDTSTLLMQVKCWLYEHRILIAHDRLLKRVIAEAIRSHEAFLEKALLLSVGNATITEWGRQLPAPEGEYGSLQQWLWAVPLKHSTVQMAELFDKIDRLYALKVTATWPIDVNETLVRYYARRCANRPPSVSKRVQSQSRKLEAACFMRYALCSATDQLLAMFRRWAIDVTNEAGRQVDGGRPDLKKQLCSFAEAVKALAQDKTHPADETLAQIADLADQMLTQHAPSRRSLIRLQLITKSAQARAMLHKLVKLPFESETQHPVIDAINVLRSLYGQNGGNELPASIEIKLGRVWRDLIYGVDRIEAMRAFEWATISALRMALRNGSVYVDHSFSFRSRATLLISEAEWKAKRHHYYGHLELPQDPKVFLGKVVDHLDQGLERLRDAYLRGEVRIEDGSIRNEVLKAEDKAPHLDALRRAIFEERPVGQLPKIILDIDSEVRFSWLLLGREPRSRSELLLVYAAVLAHGTSLSAADISRMIPELKGSAIRQMMKLVADERKLREAADAILVYMHRHPIAAHWGRGDLASSDMMSLETTRTVWQARADPRRRTASIGIYTHVRDHWGIFYDMPILLKERQVGAAIEGVVRQAGTDDVAQLAVDTHGYTDFGIAVAKGLKFDLCPVLQHMRDRYLHVPVGHEVPGEVLPVVAGDVDLDAIEAIYDEFVRVVASIQSGRCTAVQALQRFGSAARGQDVYDGGVQLGRLLRSIFLIDYFTNPVFRRELRHALNRGEAVHAVQRAVHTGKIPTELAKRPESLAAVSSSLSLLTNALMAWNTQHMQHAVERIEAVGGESLPPEDLRRIAPTNLEGINLRGTFEFPLADYAQRILPNSTAATVDAIRKRS